MKIGIVTIYGEYNYGNKFQNYAIKKMVENINNDNIVYTIRPKLTNKQKLISLLIKYGIGKYRKFQNDSFDKKKIYSFQSFSKKYLNVVTYKNLKKLNNQYDYFLAGSDQIWNTNGFKGRMLDFYLLKFASDKKRIAIAPSLGTGKIGLEQVKQFKRELPKFKKLSCRELGSVKVIEKYSMGNKCIKLSDPTMGLDKNEWELIRTKANGKPREPYIFCYFLGKLDKEINEQINKVKSNNIIINVMKKDNIEMFSNDPGQFIDLLADAQLILTDSFHGCVFSIIYNKPFVVLHTLDRKNMEDRICSLLKEFNFEDRWIDNVKYDDLYKMNFTYANKKLKDEYEKLNNYLKGALDT